MENARNKIIRYLSEHHPDYLEALLPDGATFNDITIAVMRDQSARIRYLEGKLQDLAEVDV